MGNSDEQCSPKSFSPLTLYWDHFCYFLEPYRPVLQPQSFCQLVFGRVQDQWYLNEVAQVILSWGWVNTGRLPDSSLRTQWRVWALGKPAPHRGEWGTVSLPHVSGVAVECAGVSRRQGRRNSHKLHKGTLWMHRFSQVPKSNGRS